MGSPVSVAVADLYMEDLEEKSMEMKPKMEYSGPS